MRWVKSKADYGEQSNFFDWQTTTPLASRAHTHHLSVATDSSFVSTTPDSADQPYFCFDSDISTCAGNGQFYFADKFDWNMVGLNESLLSLSSTPS